jgi:hypothetical protein
MCCAKGVSYYQIHAMKTQQATNIFRYFTDQFIGSFSGFVVGIWASSLVSHFFATRRINNLWGLTSTKTIVTKQTFGAMEWIASVFIGYIVFELVLRAMRIYLLPRTLAARARFMRMMMKMWIQIRKKENPLIQEMP